MGGQSRSVASTAIEHQVVPLVEILGLLASDDVIVIADADKRVRWVSDSVTAVLGWTPAEFALVCTHLLHPDDQPIAEAMSALVRAQPGVHHAGEGRHLASDGRWRWLRVTATNLLDQHGIVLTRFTDLTREHELQTRLEAAERDDLTGLGTRSTALRELSVRLESGDRQVAVLFGDLDGFKAVNDRFGHPAGDEVLRHLARRIQAVVRDRGVASRWGGDEVVVVVDVNDRADAEAFAARMVAEVRRPVRLRDNGVAVDGLGMSVGVAMASAGDRPADAVARADRAMYRAKQERQGVVIDDAG